MIDFMFGEPRLASMSLGNSIWQWMGGARSNSGQVINQETAYNYSAVWCATRIIAETAASLPLIEYRTLDDGGRTRASERPEYLLMKDAPNPEMGSMAFREGRTAHQVNWGNGFAEIVRDGDNATALWPIHASRVEPARAERATQRTDGVTIEEGDLIYLVKRDNGTRDTLAADEMLHVPGVLSDDGIWGRGVIPYGKESIGFGLATERHGAEFFSGGAMPAAVVTMDGLKDKAKRDEARQEWRTVFGKAGEVAFFPKDSDLKVITVPNEAAQYLQTRQFNITEMARWYNLPPHMLKELSRSTNNNIEHQSLEFVIYNLMPWLRRWEEQCNLKLVPRSQRGQLYFEHNVAGLLRGDIKARYESYSIALDRGILTINEVRRLENLNPIGPAGDQHFVQMNMTTAERMLAGQDANGQSPEQNAQAMFDRWTRKALKQHRHSRDAALFKLNNRISTLEATLQGKQDAATKPEAVKIPNHNRITEKPSGANAVRPVVLDAVSRMLVKETNAAIRASHKGEAEFTAWLSEFYAKHRTQIIEALTPVSQVLAASGHPIDLKAIASQWVLHSQAELSRLYNTATRQQFTEAVSAWPVERAKQITDTILTGKQENV